MKERDSSLSHQLELIHIDAPQVNIQLQNFTSILQLNGNASSPPIATTGARGYIADSTSGMSQHSHHLAFHQSIPPSCSRPVSIYAALWAYNAANGSDKWMTQFGDQHYHSSFAFGEDGTILVSDSTSGGLFAYGTPALPALHLSTQSRPVT
jgi:outer membrane protein assembly factor BamB